MANEVGTIGQQYENRKSKKVGVLESRDEKCKTLMMRGEDGSSFVVTYSTFKSNWRKYGGEETVAETSTQVEEKKAKVKDAEKKLTEKREKKPKKDIKQKVEEMEALKEIISSVVSKSKKDFKIRNNSKGIISVRFGSSGLFDAKIVHESDIMVGMKTFIFDIVKFDDSLKDIEVQEHDNWNMQRVITVSNKQIKTAIKNLVSASEQFINAKESEKEGE